MVPEIAGVAFSDVTAVKAARLRRRARWVRALETHLGGERGCVGLLLKRRWVPDLPHPERATVANALATLVDEGVRVLGGGLMPTQGEDPEHVVYLHVETRDGSFLTIFPGLLGELLCFAGFRPRNGSTLAALRHRALQWAAASKLAWWRCAAGFHETIALGMVASSQERVASDFLGRLGLPSLITAS